MSELPPRVSAVWLMNREDGYLRLYKPLIVDLGPAAQFYGAFLDVIDNRSKDTFCRVERIAEAACLPLRTAERHLSILRDFGLIESAKSNRRTSTHRLTRRRMHGQTFFPLPRWLLRFYGTEITWAQRVVFAFVVGQFQMLELTFENVETEAAVEIEGWRACEALNRTRVARENGISRRAVGNAMHWMTSKGWLYGDGIEDEPYLTWPLPVPPPDIQYRPE